MMKESSPGRKPQLLSHLLPCPPGQGEWRESPMAQRAVQVLGLVAEPRPLQREHQALGNPRQTRCPTPDSSRRHT